MSEDFIKVLKAKGQQFEQAKEQSMRETRNRIEDLITHLKELENDLLGRIEAQFEENIFEQALASLTDEVTSTNIKRAEEASRKPVPEPIYPKDEDLRTISNSIQKFVTIKQTPKGITANTEEANSLTLSWDKAPNATEYRAEMKRSNESDFHEIYRGTGTTVTIRDLKEEGKHQLRVCAVYGNDPSGWSDVVKVKPWVLLPPKGVVVSSEMGDSIEAKWNEVRVPVRNTVSYQVEIQPVRNTAMGKSFISGEASIIERGFEPGKEYAIRVRSVCGDSASEWGKAVSITTKIPGCLVGHTLVPYDIEDSQRRGILHTITCDNCGSSHSWGSKGIFYGCRTCNYDLCPECIKKPVHLQRKECASGHPLTLVTLAQRLAGKPFNGIICDICRKKGIFATKYPADYLVLYCPICEYDVCNECTQRYGCGSH